MLRLTGRLICVSAALLALGWFLMSQTWSGSAEPAPAKKTSRDAFAADRDNGLDAKRARRYLEQICKIGPRISGTEGMKKQLELLQKHFLAHGAKIELKRFSALQKSQRQPVDMVNLIASWHPERQRRVIICAHYDTRPIADQEPDRRKWREPFISANDGASGVALMMELAHHMKEIKASVGIDFVFFDGEEYVFEPDRDVYFFGSERFAQEYRQERPRHRYIAAVLLDMIAGKGARFSVEQNSWLKAADLVQELWRIASEQHCDAFQDKLGPDVRDDHLALNRAGIPAIDIIDFDYPHWHRLTDVPENCSGESLAQVGRVLLVWLQRVK